MLNCPAIMEQLAVYFQQILNQRQHTETQLSECVEEIRAEIKYNNYPANHNNLFKQLLHCLSNAHQKESTQYLPILTEIYQQVIMETTIVE